MKDKGKILIFTSISGLIAFFAVYGVLALQDRERQGGFRLHRRFLHGIDHEARGRRNQVFCGPPPERGIDLAGTDWCAQRFRAGVRGGLSRAPAWIRNRPALRTPL